MNQLYALLYNETARDKISHEKISPVYKITTKNNTDKNTTMKTSNEMQKNEKITPGLGRLFAHRYLCYFHNSGPSLKIKWIIVM